MDSSLYLMSSILFGVLTIALLILIIRSINGAVKVTEVESARSLTMLKIASVPVLWLIITGALGFSGFLLEFQSVPPRIFIVIVPPILLLLFLMRSKKVGVWLDIRPRGRFIGIQTMRIVVEIILWMIFMADVIPVQMTFEGRNFDILVGLTAPIIVYLMARKKVSDKVVIVWNVLGLLLVLNIVVVAILSAPLPFRQFMNEPSNTVVAYFPFVWLPSFVVPVAYYMHFLSMRQILKH